MASTSSAVLRMRNGTSSSSMACSSTPGAAAASAAQSAWLTTAASMPSVAISWRTSNGGSSTPIGCEVVAISQPGASILDCSV
jgi:hypothetical protein